MRLASRGGALGKKANAHTHTHTHAQFTNLVDVSGDDGHAADPLAQRLPYMFNNHWSGFLDASLLNAHSLWACNI